MDVSLVALRAFLPYRPPGPGGVASGLALLTCSSRILGREVTPPKPMESSADMCGSQSSHSRSLERCIRQVTLHRALQAHIRAGVFGIGGRDQGREQALLPTPASVDHSYGREHLATSRLHSTKLYV